MEETKELGGARRGAGRPRGVKKKAVAEMRLKYAPTFFKDKNRGL